MPATAPGLLAAAGAGDPRRRPPAPLGAYRDLWRARGRRLLPDRRRRAEARRPTPSPALARRHCSRRSPPERNRKRAPPAGEALSFDRRPLSRARVPAAAAAAAAGRPGTRPSPGSPSRRGRSALPAAAAAAAAELDRRGRAARELARAASGRRCAARQGRRRTAGSSAVVEAAVDAALACPSPGAARRTRPA